MNSSLRALLRRALGRGGSAPRSRLAVLSVASFLALVCCHAAEARFKRAGQTGSSATGGSLVKGKVVYADNDRPLRRVRVTIFDPSAAGRRRYFMATTDGRGEFRIRNVLPGKYIIAADAPGIIRPDPPRPGEAQKEQTSVTVDGVGPAEVVLKVNRGGAIAGKVTYADGDPALNVSVQLFRRNEGKWVPVYHMPGRDRDLTDERGIFRLSGLTPGEYIAGAMEQRMSIELTANDDPEEGNLINRATLRVTYFGGTTSPNGATIIRVEAGAEKEGINITLSDRPLYAVSGRVVQKGDNLPVSRARVSLRGKGEESALLSDLEDLVVNTDDSGSFTFEEVAEGSYTLTVSPPRFLARRMADYPAAGDPTALQGQRFATRQQDLIVAGGDLNNVMVVVSTGSRIAGRVRVEGGGPLPRTVLIFAEMNGGERRLGVGPVRVLPDGTFAFEGVAAGSIRLKALGTPSDRFETKAITLGTLDLKREPLIVKEGEDVSGIEVIITTETAP